MRYSIPKANFIIRSLFKGEFCPVCGDKRIGTALLCDRCADAVASSARRGCLVCGKSMHDCTCSTYAMKDAGFAHLFKIASYDPKENESAVNKLIFYLKLKKDKLLFRLVASLVALSVERGLCALSAVSSTPVSAVVTFIPRSRAKVRTLGNDQAKMLAKYLAKELSLPCARLLVRRKQGRAQKELSLFEREENTASMFRIRGAKHLSGKTVIIVDDLVASGNTLAQAGLALKRAGAKNVLFSCIAALEEKPKDDSFAQDIDIFG